MGHEARGGGDVGAERAASPEGGSSNGVDYESTPLSRGEYISAVVHLYRGELHRANSWRMRLDNTTNWAVITTAGILSLSFQEESSSHILLLIGMGLISVFWGFESRRYRFADIWYSRVRKIEENFYAPILRRDPVSPESSWGLLVAGDLFHPAFKIGRLEALRARLRRNYWAVFLVLVIAWVVKLLIHPDAAHSWAAVQGRLTIGFLPWWIPVAALGSFVLGAAAPAPFELVGPGRRARPLERHALGERAAGLTTARYGRASRSRIASRATSCSSQSRRPSMPPATVTTCPVTCDAATGEASQQTVRAMSFARASWRRAMVRVTRSTVPRLVERRAGHVGHGPSRLHEVDPPRCGPGGRSRS